MTTKKVSLSQSNARRAEKLFEKEKSELAATPEGPVFTIEWLKDNWEEDKHYGIPVDWLNFENTRLRNRHKFRPEKIQELKESIASQVGQIEPIVGRFDETGKIQIVVGWHRALACKEIPKNVLVRFTDMEENDLYDLTVAENIDREELSGFDQMAAMIELQKRGRSVEQIGALFHVGAATVYQTLRIGENPLIATALESDRLSLRDARTISNKVKSMNLDQATQEKIINALDEGKVRSSDLDYVIEKGGEIPAGSPAVPNEKAKGDKTRKGAPATGNDGKIYFKKFNENKIHFSATCIKGRPELKRIKGEAIKFVEALEKMIVADRRQEQKPIPHGERRKKTKGKGK